MQFDGAHLGASDENYEWWASVHLRAGPITFASQKGQKCQSLEEKTSMSPAGDW